MSLGIEETNMTTKRTHCQYVSPIMATMSEMLSNRRRKTKAYNMPLI